MWLRACGRHKPLGGLTHKFFGGMFPRPNYLFQIWWRSVQGFSVAWGSNFAIPHWLWQSSLQHSHTTVWACDVFNYSDIGRHITISSDIVRCRAQCEHGFKSLNRSSPITPFCTQVSWGWEDWGSNVFKTTCRRLLPSEIVAWPECEPRTYRTESQSVNHYATVHARSKVYLYMCNTKVL